LSFIVNTIDRFSHSSKALTLPIVHLVMALENALAVNSIFLCPLASDVAIFNPFLV
jgi:hypothetical protein